MSKSEITALMTLSMQFITAILLIAVLFRAVIFMDNTKKARVIWIDSIEQELAFQKQFQADIKAICESLPGSRECGAN